MTEPKIQNTLSNTRHFLSDFNTTNLQKQLFDNPVVMSVFYYLVLVSFIVILLSNSYLTVSNFITIYLIFIICRQIYLALFDTKNTVKFTFLNMVVPFILIIVIIICNNFLPKNLSYLIMKDDNKLTDETQQSIYYLMYASFAYSTVFIMTLIFFTFKKYGVTLFFISSILVLIGTFYLIARNAKPIPLKSDVKEPFLSAALYIPIVFFGIVLIAVMLAYITGINKEKNFFSNNLTRTTEIGPKQESDMVKKLNELNKLMDTPPKVNTPSIPIQSKLWSFIKKVGLFIFSQDFLVIGIPILFVIYYIYQFFNMVVNIEFISLETIGILVLNIFIMAVIAQILFLMVYSGYTQILKNDTYNLFLSTSNQGNSSISYGRIIKITVLLILYNVFVVNILNHDYIRRFNRYLYKNFPNNWSDWITKQEGYLPNIVTILIYALTIYIYYRLVQDEVDIKKNSDMLIFFIVLLLFYIVIYYINESKIVKKSTISSIFNNFTLPILSIIIIFGVMMFVIYITTSNLSGSSFNAEKNQFISYLKLYLFIVFGIIFIFLCLMWIYRLFRNFTLKKSDGTLNVISVLLNIAIIITTLAIVFRMLSYNNYFKGFEIIPKSPLSQLIISSIFYVPCLLIAAIDYIIGSYKKGASIIQNALYNVKIPKLPSVNVKIPNLPNLPNLPTINYTETKTSDIILFILVIILYLIYFNIQYLYTLFSSQNGFPLLEEPIYLDKVTGLASFAQLNPLINPTKKNVNLFGYDMSIYDSSFNSTSQTTTYNYAMSCWIYLDGNNDSHLGSTNQIDTSYYTIVNYGNNPCIRYGGIDNSLIVTIKLVTDGENKTLCDASSCTLNNIKYDADDQGNIIIYKNSKYALQKWNNIIINYNSGVIDIFLNGELESSFNVQQISYMNQYDILVGEENGLNGGICNVVYFNNKLNMKQIYYLYNSVKHLDPPIMLNVYNMLYLKSLKIENFTKRFGLTQVSTN